ncbi:MAG: hypothetical protein RL021_1165 [Bacteroidota bacterium]|jgi:membrane fusion protein (multidrug efflux system)
MRQLTLFALGIYLLACSGKKSEGPPKASPTAVDVVVASELSVPEDLTGNGTVLPAEVVELHIESTGRLVSLDMKDGAFVRKGTLLAKINDAELQAQLRQQRVRLDLARKNKNRYEKMLAVNGINQADYDQAVNEVASLEAEVDMTLAQIEKTELRAPFDGTLGLRMVSPGAFVTSLTVLGSIIEQGPLRIDFTLPEQYASGLKPGEKLIVTDAADDTATAILSAVDLQANPSTRNVRARAVVQSGQLTPGAYAKVRIRRLLKGITVPTQCIIPDAVANKVIVVKEGKGRYVPVRTGLRTEDVVQITDGLVPGDSVIVTGVLFVRPDAPVTIRSVKEVTVGSR